MNNQEKIECIRTIARGLEPNVDIGEFLSKQDCDSLLALTPKKANTPEQTVARALNSLAVKERFKACAPLFSQSEFRYAVIKGAVLSQMMYHDPLVRFSGDIDILIERKDADCLKQLLTANGFVQGRITDSGIVPFNRRELLFQTTLSHQTAPYVKSTGNKLCPYVNVDVNMDLFWGESDEKADMSLVLSHTEPMTLLGTTFQKLTPEAELVSLCLHHYKDLNSIYLLSHGSFQLRLFFEIYKYLRTVKPDVSRLRDLCNLLNAGQYVYVCIDQTQQIFDDPQIEPYIEALKDQQDRALHNTFGLNDRERKKWDIDLFARLFHPNLAEHLQELLGDAEKEKIKINRELM